VGPKSQTPNPGSSPQIKTERSNPLWVYWMKFNAVSLAGIGVQLVALYVLTTGWKGIDLRLATFLAVEVAILHNFAWHEAWTWQDRTRNSDTTSRIRRLLRFNLSTGLLSIVGNVLITDALVRWASLGILTANAAAICLCYLANFCLSHWFAFRSTAD
jgi:putative flippase GtrA